MDETGSRSRGDRLSGAREVADGVYVFRSDAFALNSGLVLGHPRAGARADAQWNGARPRADGPPPPSSGPILDRHFPPALLIDPGYFPSDIDRISAFLDDRGHAATHLLLTHADWDHIVGPARFPKATIIASSQYPPRVAIEHARIARSRAEFDAKLYVCRDEFVSIPVPDTLAGAPADLVWSGPAAHLLPAGGHTSDGLMLLLREDRILFAGDHLSNLEIPFVGESVPRYLATLSMVKSLVQRGEVDLLIPGHGGSCRSEEILRRIEEDTEYLARLDSWVQETARTVTRLDGLIERCEEVVFRKGWGNPDVHAEHRTNISVHARALGLAC